MQYCQVWRIVGPVIFVEGPGVSPEAGWGLSKGRAQQAPKVQAFYGVGGHASPESFENLSL